MKLYVTCNGYAYPVCVLSENTSQYREMVTRVRETLYKNNHSEAANHVEKLVQKFMNRNRQYVDLNTCNDDCLELYFCEEPIQPQGLKIILTCNGHSYEVCHESAVADNMNNLCERVRTILQENKHIFLSTSIQKLVKQFFDTKGEYTKYMQKDKTWFELYRLPETIPEPLELTQSDSSIHESFELINAQLGSTIGALLKQAFYEGYQMARDLNTFDSTKFCWPVQQEAWVNSEAFEIAEKHGYEDRKA